MEKESTTTFTRDNPHCEGVSIIFQAYLRERSLPMLPVYGADELHELCLSVDRVARIVGGLSAEQIRPMRSADDDPLFDPPSHVRDQEVEDKLETLSMVLSMKWLRHTLLVAAKIYFMLRILNDA